MASNPVGEGNLLWVGLTDEEKEGTWRFSSNDEKENKDELLFKWWAPSPDNAGGDENCAHIQENGDRYLMNDMPCHGQTIHEGNDGLYGLCEIKQS